MTHQQGLGVCAVLLSIHAVRLVRSLPDDHVAVRTALYDLGSHPLLLGAGNQFDTALA